MFRFRFTMLLASILLAAHATEPAALKGRWTNGRITSIQYRDAYTGVSRPPSGNHFAYEFNPDGTYSFTGLMQVTMYNCTTSTFAHEQGTYEVSGSQVSMHPLKNPYRMTYSCYPSSNKEAPGKLIDRTYQYRVTGGKLELISPQDNSVQNFQRSVD